MVLKLRDNVGPGSIFLSEKKKQKPKNLHAKSRFKADLKITAAFFPGKSKLLQYV